MKHLSPEFIEKLRTVRERGPRDVWLSLAAKYRISSGVPTGTAAANLAQSMMNPDQCWALRQAFKEHDFSSWAEIATAFEVVDTWVASSPTT